MAGKAGHALSVGDLLALAGASFAGAYFVIGRRLRADLGVGGYITPVYSVAAMVLFAGQPPPEAFVAYPATDWLIFAALALGPMWWPRRPQLTPCATCRLYGQRSALASPVGATLIAWTLPRLRSTRAALAGGAGHAGIALALARPAGRGAGRARAPLAFALDDFHR